MALGWGIVSTGFHPDLKVVPAIAEAQDAQLAAVYSRDRERAEAFAEKHGANAAYDDLDAMLSDARVDAVFVCSPNSVHAVHTLQSARAGKHVLCEKPMATTVEDAASMVKVCRAYGVKLGVGYHLRTHPGHLMARQAIEQGILGRLVLAQGQWGYTILKDNFSLILTIEPSELARRKNLAREQTMPNRKDAEKGQHRRNAKKRESP